MTATILVRDLLSLSCDLPNDPNKEVAVLLERVRAEVNDLSPNDLLAVAAAIRALSAACQDQLEGLRAEHLKLGGGRRAIRGYGHIRPQTRMQRIRCAV